MLEGKGYEDVLVLNSLVHIYCVMCGFVCLSLERKKKFYRYLGCFSLSLPLHLFCLRCVTDY